MHSSKKNKSIFLLCLVLSLCAFWTIVTVGCGTDDKDNMNANNDSILSEELSSNIEINEKIDNSVSITEEQLDENSESTVVSNGYIVVIDAGHQMNADSTQEPIGPGATETKPKVSAGTIGIVSGIPEYQLNLSLALKLEKELNSRGYTVVMCRTDNDVNLSNSERAGIANCANADAFIRIHANGSNDPSVNGAMAICMTANNPFNASLYEASLLLSESVLNELVEATGCKKEYIWETDTMSGINWSNVPVTIVEVGYMTNPEEDLKLSTEDYQSSVVEGLANGIDLYFHSQK